MAWVNGYHAQVLARIGPLVEGAALAWLTEACQPL
ncbi:MAG: M24 family metallopeptidase C-terminal domain-containing protein [Bosea sp. (in: a-proteobacteria)]